MLLSLHPFAAGGRILHKRFRFQSRETGSTRMKRFNRFQISALLDTMMNRRSRRFAGGMTLNGRPLSYRNKLAPQPLSEHEKANLAFFAPVVAPGDALAESPYRAGKEKSHVEVL